MRLSYHNAYHLRLLVYIQWQEVGRLCYRFFDVNYSLYQKLNFWLNLTTQRHEFLYRLRLKATLFAQPLSNHG